MAIAGNSVFTSNVSYGMNMHETKMERGSPSGLLCWMNPTRYSLIVPLDMYHINSTQELFWMTLNLWDIWFLCVVIHEYCALQPADGIPPAQLQ